MALRRAHMATFPARQHVLAAALRSLEPQVDVIHLVLNEYAEVPELLAEFRKLAPILPSWDFKDVGKFVTQPTPEDHVFFVDDDLCYAPGYCDWLTRQAEAVGLEQHVFGLHARIYQYPVGAEARSRKTLYYRHALRQTRFVDQLGTGTVLALGRNVPPLDYMCGSEKFVDVRYAKWCFENQISQIALARPFNMARPLRHGGTTIYRDFTVSSPDHVLAEIRSFAGKPPRIGCRVGPRLGWFDLFRAA